MKTNEETILPPPPKQPGRAIAKTSLLCMVVYSNDVRGFLNVGALSVEIILDKNCHPYRGTRLVGTRKMAAPYPLFEWHVMHEKTCNM